MAEIILLPALPKAWGEGSVRGLKARGGYEVDLHWSDGMLAEVKVRAARDGVVMVRYRDMIRPARMQAGKEWIWKP